MKQVKTAPKRLVDRNERKQNKMALNKFRKLLQKYREDIVRDLDVTFIIDELITKHAVTADVFDHIYTLKTRAERTRYLLETLQLSELPSIDAFVDSLAKDYKWLWEKLKVEDGEPMRDEDSYEDSFEDSLSLGDVPRLSEHYVKRVRLEKLLEEKLEALTRHKILALHGMSGSGKTALAIGVLRYSKDLVTNCFGGNVFWFSMGNCKTIDDIIAQQTKLHRKALSICPRSYMNSTISMSSIGSNTDSQSFTSYDWSWENFRDKLKTQFAEMVLKESLLVLDEVNSKNCLEAFDIGCKMLITTRDTGILTDFQPQIIEVENSLDEKESLQLFASYLDKDASELPRQARKLHEVCKGSPFHIALIGAQLSESKERLNDDPSYWNHYLNKLKKKEFKIFTKYIDTLLKTVDVCINSLSPEVLPLFKRLTILPENFQITAKVLSKLWNKDINEVEQIMKQLRGKSLIMEMYDKEQRNYVYEIHDLIMNSLKTCSSNDEKRKWHSDFLKSYNYDSSNPPKDIVEDGYIAYFIGYHILHTDNVNDRWVLFNKLFLDLGFLGSKVRLTGPADVMEDLQKYEGYIVKHPLDKELLCAIRAYISTYGNDLHRYPRTDIVQSILHNESKGLLYTKACQIASEGCAKNQLYFEFLHEQNVEEIKYSTIDVKEDITCVCFLGHYALIGTNTGFIKFFDISTNSLKTELAGTGSPIKWIGSCPSKPPVIAALGFDGIIRLWYIDDAEQDDAEDVIKEETEEPCNNNYPITLNPRLGPILNCRWSNSKEILIAHTLNKIYQISSNGTVIDCIEKSREILCCVPCINDRHVIIATNGSSHNIEVIDLISKERVMYFEETDFVMNILTVPGSNRIITLKQKSVTRHDLKLLSTYPNKPVNSQEILNSDHIKTDLCFQCIAVNKTGTLLFVATDDSRVISVDLTSNERLFNLENRRGNVISMDVSEVEVWDDFGPGSDVVLTGTSNIEQSAKVWYLDPAYVSSYTALRNGKARVTTKFDASFLHTLSPSTPTSSAPSSGPDSTFSTPKRHQSFNQRECPKTPAKKSLSLDRHSLKPLVVKGICHVEGGLQPLLAVVDDKNNIQILRGRKVIAEILSKHDEQINIVRISPCNQHVLYGLRSGKVKKYTLRTKESKVVIDVNSSVQYMNFVNSNLLIVAYKNRCMLAYKLTMEGVWMPEMLQNGNTHLGSQEILNDINGIKKKSSPSSSGSEASISSKDRAFPMADHKGRLCEKSGLFECFWIPDVGLITIEYNATIKLWDRDLKVSSILNARQSNVHVSCAAFQKNVLVICDDYNMGFQTFELKFDGDEIKLRSLQQYKLNHRISSCDLAADGNVLALGLVIGDVVIWNVQAKRQLKLLKHHKSKVQCCAFSPVPDRLFRSNTRSPFCSPTIAEDTEQPPLVLVTMATEIVWWNVTYIMKMRAHNKNNWRSGGWNTVTPLASPVDIRNDLPTALDNMHIENNHNFFFGDGLVNGQDCWKATWKGKTCKEGSKTKEILSCIKLSGMSAKKLCHDSKFSCFVTIDNTGSIHIMNVMANDT